MTKLSSILAAAALLALMGAPAHAATDGVTKTWVSSTTGNDSGTCQFTTPCKTFAYAITQTLPGGEIDVKDGGSYGPVTITEPVSIVSQGLVAAISVPSGGTGVQVNASSNDAVILEGLVIDGHNVGTNGIVANTGNSVTVIDCHIRNVNTAITASGPYMDISDTEISNAQTALQLGQSTISMNRVNLHNNNIGMIISSANAYILNSAINKNYIGMSLYSNGFATVGNTSIIDNNGYGIQLSGGMVYSFGDNYMKNNVNYNGQITSIPKQ